MTILGIGVDIVYLPRIFSLLHRRAPERVASRILSPEELVQWQSILCTDHSRRAQYLGVRWSLKESAYKALYPGVRPRWKELTYHGLGRHGEKPELTYHPHTPTSLFNLKRMHASVSHDGEYVFTTVVVEGS